MSLLILGRGKRESVSIANDMRSEPHRGWFCTHRYTYIYIYICSEGGTRVEQLIGNVSKMNASMDPGVSGDLNRTGWLEVVAAKVFGVKRPSCRIRNRNENPQVRRSKWSFGPVTLYNRTVPPPLSDGISRGREGRGGIVRLLFASIGSRDVETIFRVIASTTILIDLLLSSRYIYMYIPVIFNDND